MVRQLPIEPKERREADEVRLHGRSDDAGCALHEVPQEAAGADALGPRADADRAALVVLYLPRVRDVQR